VHNQPNVGSIQTWSDKLKTNASSVPNVLGSGSSEHLGILIAAEHYATLSQALYFRPVNSVLFVTPDGLSELVSLSCICID